MGELDFLERNMIKTLTVCSVYDYKSIEYVYLKTKSFDKTIACLKLAQAGIKVDDAILQVMAEPKQLVTPVETVQKTLSAEGFVKKHFKDIDKVTEWYPAIVAIAEGFAKYSKKESTGKSNELEILSSS